ncbi:MAG: GNAT family N-acetyltransferase [Anaerolineae bacterium]
MLTIATERLLIRNFTAADADSLREMIVQYQASEYAVYDHKWPTSAEEIRGVAEWFAGGDSFLAVCLKDDGRLIGFVALNGEGEGAGRILDLGYCFNFQYHGRGYATEACTAVLDRAFRGLEAASVTSGTAAANLPSCRLLARLGFRPTGESKGSFWQDEAGEPIEFVGHGYELTREEWLAARGE